MDDTKPEKSKSNPRKASKALNYSYPIRKNSSPSLTAKEKKVIVEDREQLAKVFKKYMVQDIESLKALLKRTDIPAIDYMIINIVVSAAQKGDSSFFEWVMSFSLPKEKPEPKQINITGGLTNTNAVNLNDLDDDELEALRKVVGKGKAFEK